MKKVIKTTQLPRSNGFPLPSWCFSPRLTVHSSRGASLNFVSFPLVPTAPASEPLSTDGSLFCIDSVSGIRSSPPSPSSLSANYYPSSCYKSCFPPHTHTSTTLCAPRLDRHHSAALADRPPHTGLCSFFPWLADMWKEPGAPGFMEMLFPRADRPGKVV